MRYILGTIATLFGILYVFDFPFAVNAIDKLITML